MDESKLERKSKGRVMRGKSWYRGHTIGWEWARAYAAGTKLERAAIRRKLGRMADSYNALVQGIWAGWSDRVEQLAPAIRDGRAPRTINPHKLAHLLERVS
jgi:hypothetical protein